jgi:glycosyltransferase involved in cell wall biosynthesis
MRHLLRFNISRANLVTAWAPHMAQAALELGAVEERLMVLPRGIPSDRFCSRRCAAPTHNDPLTLISTRSLKLDYNNDRLLFACGALKEINKDFRLTLAGDGPERKHLVNESRKLGLEGLVHFAGFVGNDDLPALLAEHNLYISLIESDGVSASLLEAMAVGLLPIVPDHPANRQWIENWRNGLLLDDLSPGAVARAILEAITNLPLRERARQQNPEIVNQRGDLYTNSKIFFQRFWDLAKFNGNRIGNGFRCE